MLAARAEREEMENKRVVLNTPKPVIPWADRDTEALLEMASAMLDKKHRSSQPSRHLAQQFTEEWWKQQIEPLLEDRCRDTRRRLMTAIDVEVDDDDQLVDALEMEADRMPPESKADDDQEFLGKNPEFNME